MTGAEQARALADQLRGLAADITPTTPEADALMRLYLDGADALAAEAALREAREALVPLGRVASSEPLSAQEYRQLGIEAHRILRAALARAGEQT